MKGRKKRVMWLTAAIVLCLATTGWAQKSCGGLFEIDKFYAFLDGVDRYGCLDPCQGSSTCFTGLVNTRSGKVIGTASACVTNCSGRTQIYCDSDFGFICGVYVCDSLYAVSNRGKALADVGQLSHFVELPCTQPVEINAAHQHGSIKCRLILSRLEVSVHKSGDFSSEEVKYL